MVRAETLCLTVRRGIVTQAEQEQDGELCVTVRNGVLRLPEGLRGVGETVFRESPGLREVILPEGMTFVGESAFQGCRKLRAVSLPESLTEIAEEAFRDCSSLEEGILPPQLQILGEGAFRGCSKLQAVSVPESITELRPSVFAQCFGLRQVSLPAGLRSILDGAFAGCSALQAIGLPEGLESMGDGVFQGSGLEDIRIPDRTKTLGSRAFESCRRLRSISLGSGLEQIGEEAFSGCTGLPGVTLPRGLKELGKDVFSHTSFSTVTLPASVERSGVWSVWNGRKQVTVPGRRVLAYGEAFQAPDLVLRVPDVRLSELPEPGRDAACRGFCEMLGEQDSLSEEQKADCLEYLGQHWNRFWRDPSCLRILTREKLLSLAVAQVLCEIVTREKQTELTAVLLGYINGTFPEEELRRGMAAQMFLPADLNM